MQILRMVSGPLIGALIGYITNYLAIKMLFRPIKPVMIGRFRVPFTPGIVPKRKDELASVLGKAIVAKFFNADDLENIFTSDSFKSAVADNIVCSLYDEAAHDGGTIALAIKNDDYQKMTDNIKEAVCARIQAGIIRSGIAGVIAEEGGRIIEKRYADSMVGVLVSRQVISIVAEPLGEVIEKSFAENGREIIMPLLDDELALLAKEPRQNIISKIVPDREVLYRLIGDVYSGFMLTHVRPIVESIDVGGMITEKVVQMDPRDVEGLVLDVVKRELNYVVLLGALLGFIIGIVNIFI